MCRSSRLTLRVPRQRNSTRAIQARGPWPRSTTTGRRGVGGLQRPESRCPEWQVHGARHMASPELEARTGVDDELCPDVTPPDGRKSSAVISPPRATSSSAWGPSSVAWYLAPAAARHRADAGFHRRSDFTSGASAPHGARVPARWSSHVTSHGRGRVLLQRGRRPVPVRHRRATRRLSRGRFACARRGPETRVRQSG